MTVKQLRESLGKYDDNLPVALVVGIQEEYELFTVKKATPMIDGYSEDQGSTIGIAILSGESICA